MLKLIIDGVEERCVEGTTYLELAKRYQKNYDHDILLAKNGGYLKELNKTVEREGEITFLTAQNTAGISTYNRSVLFLFLNNYVYFSRIA